MKPVDPRPCDAAYQHALDRLSARINYERNPPHQGVAEFKLDRMREFLARLGNPERDLKIVHVAGTKGKGSTSTLIASALTAAGLRTGLYTSPHLDRVEQRLAIDGQACYPEEFHALVDAVWPVVEAMDQAATAADPPYAHGPTYFEILTAMAFLHFARSRTDAVVLEVGLGGRLDSTNVCQSTVAVITSISFDHTQQLGNTLTAIAGEKAGIIKPGVPVISGVLAPEAQVEIHRIAREQNAKVLQLGRDFRFTYYPPKEIAAEGRFAASLDYEEDNDNLLQVPLNLLGQHQGANAAVALATLNELKRQGWVLPEAALRLGFARAQLPARIELVAHRPSVVLDAAHNVASIEALLQVLQQQFAGRRLLLIFATTQDKDVRGILSRLIPCFDEIVLTRYQNSPRGVPLEQLTALARELGCTTYHTFENLQAAWEYTREIAQPDDLVCITGSFFLASEFRRILPEPSTSIGSTATRVA